MDYSIYQDGEFIEVTEEFYKKYNEHSRQFIWNGTEFDINP